MAIFDQIIGSLTGESSLRRIRDRSIQAGRSAYDPTILNPQIGVAQQQAVQGIDEGAYRRDVLNQLFRPVSSAVYGGNQAAAIAGASAQDMARTRALGTFESQLAQQDIQAKQAGAEQLGKLQSSQLQLQGQREAYTQQVNAEYEAEVDSRRRQLGTSLVNFGIQAAGGPLAIGKAMGAGMGGLMDKLKTSIAERDWTNEIMGAAQNRTVAQLDPRRLAQMGVPQAGDAMNKAWGMPWNELANELNVDFPSTFVEGKPFESLQNQVRLQNQMRGVGSVNPLNLPRAPQVFAVEAPAPAPRAATTGGGRATTAGDELPAGLSEEEFNRAMAQQRGAGPANYYTAQQAAQQRMGTGALSMLLNMARGANPLMTMPPIIDTIRRNQYEEYRRRTQGN